MVFGGGAKIIGRYLDSNDRKYEAYRRGTRISIRVYASGEDRKNIQSYGANCVTNIIRSREEEKGQAFEHYAGYVRNYFEENNWELHCFISRLVFAYRMEKLQMNTYQKYKKNYVLFSCPIQVDEIIENGKRCWYRGKV